MRIYTDYTRKLVSAAPAFPASDANLGARTPPPVMVDTPAPPSIQNYIERVIKLIPGEVILVYPVISGLLTDLPNPVIGTSISGAVAMFLTWFLRTYGLEPSTRPQRSAVAISTIACLIWIYHEHGYILLKIPTGYENVITVILIVFVIVTAPFVPGDKRIIN